jgi:hypothetical protein
MGPSEPRKPSLLTKARIMTAAIAGANMPKTVTPPRSIAVAVRPLDKASLIVGHKVPHSAHAIA